MKFYVVGDGVVFVLLGCDVCEVGVSNCCSTLMYTLQLLFAMWWFMIYT